MCALDEVSKQKQELRKFYRNERLKISEPKRQAMNKAICLSFLGLDKYLNSEKIFIYLSKKTEVDTSLILKHSLESKKKVLAPKCSAFKEDMDFYSLGSEKDLSLGLYSIYEPIQNESRREKDFSEGLCIVPGFCFDKKGFRVGYGKGYYDRFLKNFGGVKVGLCYNDFILDSILHDKFDVAVDMIITEKNVINIK